VDKQEWRRFPVGCQALLLEDLEQDLQEHYRRSLREEQVGDLYRLQGAARYLSSKIQELRALNAKEEPEHGRNPTTGY